MSGSRWFYLDPGAARLRRMKRTVLSAAESLAEEVRWLSFEQGKDLGRSAYRWLFVTLTYRKVSEWEAGHISEFVAHCRDWFGYRGHPFLYVWVGELQKRGALHYHMLVAVPRGQRMPSPDLKGWWPHGMSNVQTARNPVGYLAKYASKVQSKELAQLPRGVRIHGWGGLSARAKDRLRSKLMPQWRLDMLRARGLDRQIEEREAEDADREHYLQGFLVHSGQCSAEESAAWWAEEERRRAVEADAYDAVEEELDRFDRLHEVSVKGRCAYRRVSGGFVDVVEGEFFPTPFVVGSELGADGSRRWWCEDRSELRFGFADGAFVTGDRPGERWKLAAGYVPLSREKLT